MEPLCTILFCRVLRWNRLDRKLILASTSPRRRDILCRMGLTFTAVAPEEFDEDTMLDPADIEGSVRRLALRKASGIADRSPEALVLAGDTVVAVDSHLLGKPRDRDDARRMIGLLSGRSHTVLSGVALVCRVQKFEAVRCAVTRVFFRYLEEWEIGEYLDRAAYQDKAGAYGIQEDALAFVERIEGCYYNVVGLPVSAVISLLKEYVKHTGA